MSLIMINDHVIYICKNCNDRITEIIDQLTKEIN